MRRRIRIRDIKSQAYAAASNANVAALRGQHLVEETARKVNELTTKVDTILEMLLELAEEVDEEGLEISLEKKDGTPIKLPMLGETQLRLRFGDDDDGSEIDVRKE